MEECQTSFEYIKKLLTTPPLLCMLTANDKFRLESKYMQNSSWWFIFLFQKGQCLLTGYHLKKLPQLAYHYGITELELTGLVCNIDGFGPVSSASKILSFGG